MPSVYFVNEGRTLDVLPGTNLRELAFQGGIPLYKALPRILHFNFKLGPLKVFSASDVVEVEGKGANSRSEEELKALEGRLLTKYKVNPNYRIASQVLISGDVLVRTLVKRELAKKLTKERLRYLAVVVSFAVLVLVMLALVGLDLVKKM